MPHIHDKYDFVITVFIVYDHKVLLVNHPRYNKWLPMGGHIELNEDPEEALFREIQEETGLEVEIIGTKPSFTDTKAILTPSYIDVHEANSPHKHIALVYFARAKTNRFILSDEHTAIEWLGVNDVGLSKYALSESIQFYCREAIQRADK